MRHFAYVYTYCQNSTVTIWYNKEIKNGPVDLTWNVFRKKHKIITKNIGKLALLEQG